MAKENQLIIQLRGFDAKHYIRTERYAKQVAKLYQTAADEFASLAGKINLPAGGTFNFDDFPKAKKQARGIVTRLAGKIEAVVTSGQRSGVLAYKVGRVHSSIVVNHGLIAVRFFLPLILRLCPIP